MRASDGKDFKRPLDEQDYRDMIKKLNGAGMLYLKENKIDGYCGAHYKLILSYKGTLTESYYYPEAGAQGGDKCFPELLVRTMRNGGIYFSPE